MPTSWLFTLQETRDHSDLDEVPFVSLPFLIFRYYSAGGIGVLMNVDRLSRRLIQRLGYPVLISGIIDSAWFIHTPAYREAKCNNVFECPAEEGIHRGMRYIIFRCLTTWHWNTQLRSPFSIMRHVSLLFTFWILQQSKLFWIRECELLWGESNWKISSSHVMKLAVQTFWPPQQ